jgi:thioredoxin reductase (NADPH)
VYLTGLVVQAGRIHRIPPAQFRRLMAEDAELSDIP